MINLIFKIFLNLLQKQNYKEMEKQREIFSNFWFIAKMATIASTEPGQNQNPRASEWIAAVHILRLSSAAFTGTSPGS